MQFNCNDCTLLIFYPILRRYRCVIHHWFKYSSIDGRLDELLLIGSTWRTTFVPFCFSSLEVFLAFAKLMDLQYLIILDGYLGRLLWWSFSWLRKKITLQHSRVQWTTSTSLLLSHVWSLMFIRQNGPPLKQWNPQPYVRTWLLNHSSAIDTQARQVTRSSSDQDSRVEPKGTVDTDSVVTVEVQQ